MATELPKDKKNYIIIEPTKVTIALFTVLIGLVGWIGKAMFEKLTSIESDVKILLVAQSIDKTNIDNIKDQMKKHDDKQDERSNQQQPIKDKKVAFMLSEFILPENTTMSLDDNKHNRT